MMTTIRSRDSKRRLWQPFAAFGALVLVLILGTAIAPFIRNSAVSLIAPSTASTSPYAGLSRDALIQRLSADDAKLQNIGYQAILYGLLADENAKLRALLNAPAAEKGITARVVARPPRTLYDTLLVDQGAAAGVAVGDLAVLDGIALGKVVTAGTHTATISLFSSPGTGVDALIGTPPAIVVAHGVGGGAFELSVPHGVTITVGDTVRFQNSAGLLLGVVAGIDAKPTDALQTVYVYSPISLSSLDFVEILSAQK
ncbi:MAG: rod shape-determining protein MreC [Patescibacteria group bacterium]|nr:rod shape-determining protein MreC [Patescibacteria group bacterium]